jgi:hypothetical protein
VQELSVLQKGDCVQHTFFSIFFLLVIPLLCSAKKQESPITIDNLSGADSHLHQTSLFPLLKDDPKAVVSWFYDKIWYKYRYVSVSGIVGLSAFLVYLYKKNMRK